MRNIRVYSLKILAFFILLPTIASSTVLNASSCSTREEMERQFKFLEPEKPADIGDPPFYEAPLPAKIYTANEIISKGTEIPVHYIYIDPSYKRPAYKSYWHSTNWRWSYVPNRIHYAMHKVFTTYPSASLYYDFIHDLGIAEESEKFKTDNSLENIHTVVFQTEVEKVYTYGNQILILGRPKLTGVYVFEIPESFIKPDDINQSILVQLNTLNGDELDYTAIYLRQINP